MVVVHADAVVAIFVALMAAELDAYIPSGVKMTLKQTRAVASVFGHREHGAASVDVDWITATHASID